MTDKNIISETRIDNTIERRFRIFGTVAVENNLKKRQEYQRDMERNLMTPKAYWQLLKSTWSNMSDEEKQLELATH